MVAWFQRKVLNIIVLMKLWYYEMNYPFSKEKILKVQRRELKKLMKRAYKLPFYKKRFDSVGLRPEDIKTKEDLLRLPLLKKDEFRQWVEDEYNADPERYKYWFKDSTSGSTGAPVATYLTAADKASNMANWLRMAKVQGFRPLFDKTFSIVSPHRLKQKDSILQKLGLFQRHSCSYLATAKEMVDDFNNVKPDFMYSNKSMFVKMAQYTETNKIKLHPMKCYASCAETLDHQSRRLIESQFGVDKLFDTFGSTETGSMAFELIGEPGKYVICHDTHIINLIDPKGKLTNKGRTVITSLYYHGFPIINYDLGDYMEIEVFDGIEYITKIIGRMDDDVVAPDGERLSFHYYYEALEPHDELEQFRIVQENLYLVKILLVGRKDVIFKREKTEFEIVEYLDQSTGHPEMKYEFTWLDQIPPDPSGKVRMVQSNIKKQ